MDVSLLGKIQSSSSLENTAKMLRDLAQMYEDQAAILRSKRRLNIKANDDIKTCYRAAEYAAHLVKMGSEKDEALALAVNKYVSEPYQVEMILDKLLIRQEKIERENRNRAIRKRHRKGAPCAKLAKDYGLSRQTVHRIVKQQS